MFEETYNDETRNVLNIPSARLMKLYDIHGDVVGEFFLPDDGIKIGVTVSTTYKSSYELSLVNGKTVYFLDISTRLGENENGHCMIIRSSPKAHFTPEEVEAARGLLSKGENKVRELLDCLVESDKIDE